MDRKDFLKKSVLGAAGVALTGRGLNAKNSPTKESTYDRLIDQVGFNHLPNNEESTMQSVLHKANTRGHANHGWLDSHHSFSFANYYNPDRMNFGVLRVLNDDIVAGGRGFNTHAHDNMEIISIPLSGDLQHKDSMGNVTVIKQGDVQVMSAGTGIKHSEYNKNADKEVRFLQIWMFPNAKDLTPRYDQISIKDEEKLNEWQQILSPSADDAGVWAHQHAWFHLGKFEEGCEQSYEIKSEGNGAYIFVLEGEVTVNDQELQLRDGYGIWDTESFTLRSTKSSRVLLMDVPMQLS